MSRQQVIEAALAHFDSGAFRDDLARRVQLATESQIEGTGARLQAYLDEIVIPGLNALGFSHEVLANPVEGFGPILIAERVEPGAGFTVLSYGHGDVVMGYDEQWHEGRSPWRLSVEGDRWYGRGTADNKGQHAINLAALARVIAVRGELGYNVRLIIEMGEETGSPGLRALCERERDRLAADVFIASDGPRLGADKPTLFLGSRGSWNVNLSVEARDRAHHSGNWGGVLKNPATRLNAALASIVDERGRLLVEGLRPPAISDSVRRILAQIEVGGGETDPPLDEGWGEPGLSAAERLLGWNTFEILAMTAGSPEAPANAIPARARANCQLRYVVGSRPQAFFDQLRAHLDAHGFGDVHIENARITMMPATRLDPDDPWVAWALASMARSTAHPPMLLPNLGGSLPNDVFADVLALPTLWVPHSYPACNQHAPDEHLLGSVARESLAIMAGLWWDLAEQGGTVIRERAQWQTA
ncbi:acetylornithine deacetylase/succinyl-diaminopimelate desuccinylase-like protein [Kushneria sinocarnis]|uniref:Acetylornithine deacetylase/succinyl-diaminopimelate desuccinylase-like protein n=1 Tax=Kushneria sinocarnis TaxID=595502 RepID=A0A420WZQ3_9GAMM|nr:M20 family metallopeptidase [Kushneria sinocarnis]RKR06823.1 acetylornithine deacetylase/succinyl-diaminopimelate desuccinylase-like protein [Kushneria sinocarnis]